MKHEKEYMEHKMPKRQERTDRDHLQIELKQDEKPNGSTTEEELRVHPRHLSENMNGKEA